MKVLFEQSGYSFQNLGDWAMLQVAVARVQWALPGTTCTVVALHDAPLERCVPSARLLPLETRDALVFAGFLLGRYPRIARVIRHFARGQLRAFSSVLGKLDIVRRGGMATLYAEALAEMGAADAVVSSGGGFITDVFPGMVEGVLGTLEVAQRLGKPTAMFGQGLGPLDDAFLRHEAASVLPRLQVLALREPLSSARIARSLGVPSDRLLVTGDDATELAFELQSPNLGSGIAYNLRLAGYSGVDSHLSRQVGASVAAFAESVNSRLLVLPIDVAEGADWECTWRSLGVHEPGPCPVTKPEDAIQIAGQCRLTVTGSYHAGVFSLAQGVPVVGLVRSPYYADKFRGLKALYPDGCEWIDLSAPDATKLLFEAMGRLFSSAPQVRQDLLDRSYDLVNRSRDAYAQFFLTVADGAIR
ncbi:MAG: polysaccharide pyruvyl transferase family protein [Fimbriimonadaceae bacterium]